MRLAFNDTALCGTWWQAAFETRPRAYAPLALLLRILFVFAWLPVMVALYVALSPVRFFALVFRGPPAA